ncbi:MAG: hypothetical protein ACFFBD_21505 [Candidatus Hodarchaeota archaeon]
MLIEPLEIDKDIKIEAPAVVFLDLGGTGISTLPASFTTFHKLNS